MGGAVKAVEQGYIQREIQDSSMSTKKKLNQEKESLLVLTNSKLKKLLQKAY
jgi:methylmalonyl-CoA mutase N-terminal domain/subunit